MKANIFQRQLSSVHTSCWCECEVNYDFTWLFSLPLFCRGLAHLYSSEFVTSNFASHSHEPGCSKILKMRPNCSPVTIPTYHLIVLLVITHLTMLTTSTVAQYTWIHTIRLLATGKIVWHPPPQMNPGHYPSLYQINRIHPLWLWSHREFNTPSRRVRQACHKNWHQAGTNIPSSLIISSY